jgi:hypothetical protein
MRVVLLSAVLVLLPLSVQAFEVGGRLEGDTLWQGEVVLAEDVLVPQGTTLTLGPGTVLKAAEHFGSRSSPEYLASEVELIVKGTLVIKGQRERPVRMLPQGTRWAGIVLDGGVARITYLHIQGAETGLYCLNCTAELQGAVFRGNHYGVVLQGRGSTMVLQDAELRGNRYGLLMLQGPKLRLQNARVEGNEVLDVHEQATEEFRAPSEPSAPAPEAEASMFIPEPITLLTDTVWSGRVVVAEVVKVAPGAKLIIMPGTVVEFLFTDTNRDGIGQSGLLVQGTLWAKGTVQRPIRFTAALKRKGAWEGLSFMASDRAQNILEHCILEYAYRGLHSHFSLLRVEASVLRENFIGMQFQDSEVDIRETKFLQNIKALQFRDSVARLTGNLLRGNYTGLNALRSEVVFRDNLVEGHIIEGLKLRESRGELSFSRFLSNRKGLQVLDSQGFFRNGVVKGNLEGGLYVKNSTFSIQDSVFSHNGLNGLYIEASSGTVKGNHILRNGLHGLSMNGFRGEVAYNLIQGNEKNGIALKGIDGKIFANAIFGNGEYEMGIKTSQGVDARHNWWGSTVEKEIERKIFDQRDDIKLGRVRYKPYLKKRLVL